VPQRNTNQIARILAVVGLVTVLLLVVITIATSGGDSGGGGGGNDTTQAPGNGPTAKGRQAVEAGVWIVHEGDTLTQISEQTGIDIDDLVDLNPDADPQALISGQRIALR
jgi:LysM repeat protein